MPQVVVLSITRPRENEMGTYGNMDKSSGPHGIKGTGTYVQFTKKPTFLIQLFLNLNFSLYELSCLTLSL